MPAQRVLCFAARRLTQLHTSLLAYTVPSPQDDAAQEAKLAKETRKVNQLRRNANELKNVGINSGSDLLLKKIQAAARRASALEQSMQATHSERSRRHSPRDQGTHAKVISLAISVRPPTTIDIIRIGKLDVFQQDRLVLLGRNGVGKSQFARLLRRDAEQRGNPGVRASPSIVIGYVDQLMSHLPEASTPHESISGTFRPGDQRTISLWRAQGSMSICNADRSRRSRRDRRRGSAAGAAFDRAELLPDGRADQSR